MIAVGDIPFDSPPGKLVPFAAHSHPVLLKQPATLERREGRFRFTDSYRQERVGRELLVAAATVRGGELVPSGGLRMRHPEDGGE